LSTCLYLSDVRLAAEIVNEVEMTRKVPNTILWNDLLKMYVNNNNKIMVEKVWKLMKSSECSKPDKTSYTHLLRMLITETDNEFFHSTTSEMLSSGFITSDTYTQLIDHYIYQKNSADIIRVLVFMDIKGIQYHSKEYRNLLQYFTKSQQYLHAMQVLLLMAKQGLKPQAYYFNVILHNYAKQHNYDQLEYVLGEMDALGVLPNGYTYHIIIRLYISNYDVKAIEYVHDLACRNSIKFDKQTYLELLKFYHKSSMHERFYRTINEFLASDFQLDVHMCNEILMLVDDKHLETAFRSMIKQGIMPNEYTFRVLIQKFKEKKKLFTG